MCGIAGILNADPDRAVETSDLAWMRDRLRHRGPDADGSLVVGPCGLVHTRLSILDLSQRARQPMVSDDGRLAIVYNGEVYNFRELRRELEAAGVKFRSDGDTEVVLRLFEWGGLAALERLEGMFAFAIYDRAERRLYLMRDRVGVKPLFFTRGDEAFAFASEPKALPPLAPSASPDAATIAEYLAFRHLAGRESLSPGVETLLPGQRLTTDGREVWKERWWKPAPHRSNPDALDATLDGAVRRQLVSDVPVGVFLSGGVDSSLVTASAASALEELETFSVGFHEAGWDETDRARIVAEATRTGWHVVRLHAEEYAAGLGEAIWHLDAPLNHAHSVHLLHLSRFARRRITVALTGEGGDELFAGYPRYRLFLLGRWLRFLPDRLRSLAIARLRASRPRVARLLEAGGSDLATAMSLNAAFVPLEDAAALAGLERPEAALAPRRTIADEALADGAGPVAALLSLEQGTYLVSLLQRMDRMSMAAGLECRVPLLDESLLDFSRGLSVSARIDATTTKKPLRAAAARRYGHEYANAPKSGFGVPLDQWFRSEAAAGKLLAGLLADPRTRERGWFDTTLALHWMDEHRRGERDRTEALWGLLNLELWARVCVDGDGPEGATL